MFTKNPENYKVCSIIRFMQAKTTDQWTFCKLCVIYRNNVTSEGGVRQVLSCSEMVTPICTMMTRMTSQVFWLTNLWKNQQTNIWKFPLYNYTAVNHEFPQISRRLLHQAVMKKLNYYTFYTQRRPKMLREIDKEQWTATALSFLGTCNKDADYLLAIL